MTHSTLNPLTSSAQVATPSRRIVELPMRLFHTFMAISFVGAYITAESERFRLLHVSLGYTLFGLVILPPMPMVLCGLRMVFCTAAMTAIQQLSFKFSW